MAEPKSLKTLQDEVDRWATQFEPPYWPPLEILGRMTEEVGELARLVNHYHGHKKIKPTEKPLSAGGQEEFGDELADIIFTAICMANSKGINLEDAFSHLMEKKCYGRDNNRYVRKPAEK